MNIDPSNDVSSEDNAAEEAPSQPAKEITGHAEEPKKVSALSLMARRLNVEPEKMLRTLKDTVFKGASDSELLMLVVVANEYGLNPLLREIYAFPNRGGGIVPVVSVDGWISMVNRQHNLDGLEFEFADLEDGTPLSCTCTIYIKDRSHPVRVSEFFQECFRATEPWKVMPRRMLRHKALKEAARIAFGFSGVTDEDEARDVSANAVPFPPAKPATRGKKPDFKVEKPAMAHEVEP